jgi:hypothetical protein
MNLSIAASGPAVCGAHAPVARPAVGPGVCPPLRCGFPAVLRAGRPANNSPSKRHRALLLRPSSELKQICWTPLRGATFHPFRSSAALTGRRPALPQGLEQHRGFRRTPPRACGQRNTTSRCRPPLRTPRSCRSPSGQAGRRPVRAAEERRGWKVAARSAVPQTCLSSELGRGKSARWNSRASCLRAFQPRAPQGTRSEAEGKRPGRRPACPLGRALVSCVAGGSAMDC